MELVAKTSYLDPESRGQVQASLIPSREPFPCCFLGPRADRLSRGLSYGHCTKSSFARREDNGTRFTSTPNTC